MNVAVHRLIVDSVLPFLLQFLRCHDCQFFCYVGYGRALVSKWKVERSNVLCFKHIRMFELRSE